MPTRILLAHLDPEVEAELDQVLANTLLEVEHTTKDESFIDWRRYDVVFCSPKLAEVCSILRASSGAPPKPAVIAASRIPEIKEWLDVLEAGANDYCAAPFERSQINSILHSCAAA